MTPTTLSLPWRNWTMEETADKLRQIELFSRLEIGDLRRLARLFERAEYRQDDCLTQRGETSTCLHLLESGRATAWRMDSGGVEEPVRDLGPGDSFGVAALFLDDASDLTVQVTENSTVLSLERSRLDQYLDDFPQVRDSLLLPAAIEERLSAPQFDWMTAGEYVVFFSTKSRWALAAAEVAPLLIFLALTTVASLTRHVPYLPAMLTASATLVGGGLALIKWQDWRNDYYVVTNKRVVHHESRLPTLRVTVKQAPLHQVQNINMLKPGPIARGFNFGALDIQTAGVEGSITFRYLDDPGHCQELIFDLLEKTRSLERASEFVTIRRAMEQRLEPQEEPEKEPEAETAPPIQYTSGEAVWDIESPPTEPTEKTERKSVLAGIGRRIGLFLPRFREERGQVVTWHKHPFVLIKAIWTPALILLAALLAGVAWAAIGGESFSSVVLVLFFIWCLSLFWLLWRYEDWRNDVFQMTASHIIDIDRLPLGLRESKRQASLQQVQNVNAEIPNAWARLFNYGSVVIETAGAAGDLTFEWVMRPRAVQAEIFQRMEALRAKQRAEEAERRRTEMANWFAVYDEMKEGSGSQE